MNTYGAHTLFRGTDGRSLFHNHVDGVIPDSAGMTVETAPTVIPAHARHY